MAKIKRRTVTTETAAAQAPSGGSARKPMKRGRRRDYNLAEDAPKPFASNDLTIVPSATDCAVVRPAYKNRDALIFRPLGALEDVEDLSKAKWLPYRTSTEPDHLTDWWREVHCVKGFGIGTERYTVALYDPLLVRDGYDLNQNPYMLALNAATKATRKDPSGRRTIPHVSWLDLTVDRDRYLSKDTTLAFMQGLIYVKGQEVYTAGGKPPRGAGADDRSQIVQLTSTAARPLKKLMNEISMDWDGNPARWEDSMAHGDPIHPLFGRFFRVIDPSVAGTEAGDLQDADNWEVGASRGDDNSRDSKRPQGYTAMIDKQLIIGGQVRKGSPQLAFPKRKVDKSQALKTRIKFWDEILYFPTELELARIVAKGLRGCRALLLHAWKDHPEWLEDDLIVNILSKAQQVIHGHIGEVPDNVATSSGQATTSASVGGEWGGDDLDAAPAHDESEAAASDGYDYAEEAYSEAVAEEEVPGDYDEYTEGDEGGGEEEEGLDLAALGEAADNGDPEAVATLTALFDRDPDTIPTWVEVAELVAVAMGEDAEDGGEEDEVEPEADVDVEGDDSVESGDGYDDYDTSADAGGYDYASDEGEPEAEAEAEAEPETDAYDYEADAEPEASTESDTTPADAYEDPDDVDGYEELTGDDVAGVSDEDGAELESGVEAALARSKQRSTKKAAPKGGTKKAAPKGGTKKAAPKGGTKKAAPKGGTKKAAPKGGTKKAAPKGGTKKVANKNKGGASASRKKAKR